jgi:aminobenzoyl-glutamate utilization protein B
MQFRFRPLSWIPAAFAATALAVTRGVAGMPTSFVASAGSGAPVIGILAEYDAVPKTY